MHPARHHRSILFGLVAVAAVLSFAGCTLVGDSTTGLSMSRVNPSTCIKSCVGSMQERIQAEIALHKTAVEACAELAEEEVEACLQAEAARHSAAMQLIAGDRFDCMNSCHRQGNGSAG